MADRISRRNAQRDTALKSNTLGRNMRNLPEEERERLLAKFMAAAGQPGRSSDTQKGKPRE
jgi:hypothetical protein